MLIFTKYFLIKLQYKYINYTNFPHCIIHTKRKLKTRIVGTRSEAKFPHSSHPFAALPVFVQVKLGAKTQKPQIPPTHTGSVTGTDTGTTQHPQNPHRP